MIYKAIIFDLDGVLVDSYECWWHLTQEARVEQGKGPISRAEFDEAWGQGPEDDQKMFFPEWSVLDLTRYYDRNFLRFAKWVKTEPGAKTLLESLKQSGKLTGVASNSTPLIVKTLLQEASLYEYVDSLAGADAHTKGKPAPDMLFRVMRELSVAPDETCYVGDSVFDERAARAAKIHFVGYKRGGDQTIRTLEELLQFTGGH